MSIPAGTTGASHYAGIVAVNAADLITPAIRRKSKRPAFTFYRVSRQALPLTVHLPGRLTHSLSLISVKLSVANRRRGPRARAAARRDRAHPSARR